MPLLAPPPAPPAILLESQALKPLAHGNEAGPPRSLMPGPRIDLKKISTHYYMEVVYVEGNSDPIYKLPSSNQLTVSGIRAVLNRPIPLDARNYKLTPFWMTPSGHWHNRINTTYPIGWGLHSAR